MLYNKSQQIRIQNVTVDNIYTTLLIYTTITTVKQKLTDQKTSPETKEKQYK